MSNGGLASAASTINDVVVDASVGVKWFVQEKDSAEAMRLLEATFKRHAPFYSTPRSAKQSGKKSIREKSWMPRRAGRLFAAW